MKKLKEVEKALKSVKKFLKDNATGLENDLKKIEDFVANFSEEKKKSDNKKNLETECIESASSLELDAFVLEDKLAKSFDIVAFSDGACRGNPGPGGWGCLILSSENEVLHQSSGVKSKTTNNRMELQGAIVCLNNLSHQKDKKIALVSDSKYVVDGIKSWVFGWKRRGWKKADGKAPENLDLWQELDSVVNDFNSLEFKWVKGHSGYPQNEYVDQLANNALDKAGY